MNRRRKIVPSPPTRKDRATHNARDHREGSFVKTGLGPFRSGQEQANSTSPLVVLLAVMFAAPWVAAAIVVSPELWFMAFCACLAAAACVWCDWGESDDEI